MTTINQLQSDNLSDYQNNDSIGPELLTALKKSPLSAFSLSNEPTTDQYWKNEILGLNTSLSNDTAKSLQLRCNNKYVDQIKEGCNFNVSMYTSVQTNEVTIPVKARYDAINIQAGYIMVLIQSDNASPLAFKNEATINNYHIESAFLMFLARQLFKKEFTVYYIVQEKKAPFNNAVYKVTESMRIKGESEIIELLAAAMALKDQHIKPSYGVFADNINGVFDLDINEDYQPANFNNLL